MRAGGLQFDTSADWFPGILQEMLHFPRGKFSDQVDALAWIGQALAEMGETKTWKELADEDAEREYDETYLMFDDGLDAGRDYMTGY